MITVNFICAIMIQTKHGGNEWKEQETGLNLDCLFYSPRDKNKSLSTMQLFYLNVIHWDMKSTEIILGIGLYIILS